MFSSNRPDDTLRNDRLDHPYPEALDLYVGDLADDPITLTRWTATPDVDERHPQPLEGWEFLTVTTDDAGARGLGFGWRDSSIVAVDTVVRYRTFTQFRDALPLPVAGDMPVMGRDLIHVMATRGGRTQWTEVAIPDLSALHAAPSLRRNPPPPCPFPQNCPLGNKIGPRTKSTSEPTSLSRSARRPPRPNPSRKKRPWRRTTPR